MQISKPVMDAVNRAAEMLGVEPATMLAVLEVEGAASDMVDGVQDGKVHGYVLIRFEGHYFLRYLPEHLKKAGIKAGLAAPRAGAVKNPGTMAARYKMLQRAMAIDEEAALYSISMGVGQVMGANHRLCKIPTVQEMWRRSQTLAGQVDIMAAFIKSAGLADELQRKDFAGFARGYNGPAYKKYKYDTKMAQAYRRYSGKVAPPQVKLDTLSMGDKRVHEVKAVQEKLLELGYQVKPDGDFGPSTRSAVKLFQIEHGITVDGMVGPETREAIAMATPRMLDAPRAGTTAKELAKESRIVSGGRAIQAAAGGGAALIGGVKAGQESGLLDQLNDVNGKVTAVSSILDPLKAILAFAMENWWIAAIAAMLLSAYFGHRIVRARLEDHWSGRTV